MEKRMLAAPEICDAAISAGINKVNLRALQMLLLGILAGIFIAIGGLASTIASHSIDNFSLSKLVTGAVFPVGLMLVIICGGELFTGNVLISTAVFDRKVGAMGMLKNWVIVYAGNFIGSLIFALLAYYAGIPGLNGGKVGAAIIKTAQYKGSLTFGSCIASGILCNLLVCLAVWGAYAAKDIAGKIFIIWFPIMAFVVSGFEHSIANMYYFSIGIFVKSNAAFVKAAGFTAQNSGNVSFIGALMNIIPVTIGNIIGGAIFVGLAYWTVYKRSSSSNSISGNISMKKCA